MDVEMEVNEGDTGDYESSSLEDLMSDVEGHVTELMRKHNRAPKDAWESWQAFSHAVNWNETFIRALLGFHIVLLTTVILTRRQQGVQLAIFVLISCTVFLAEAINRYCASHWREIATQNYFDEHGSFASVFLCAPLLFIAFVQLVNLLLLVASDMIKAKRMQLKQQFKANKAAEVAAAAGAEGAAGSATTSDPAPVKVE